MPEEKVLGDNESGRRWSGVRVEVDFGAVGGAGA